MKLGINGLGRIGKLTLWHHVSRQHYSEIVVNIGQTFLGLSVGCATRTIADTVAIGQEDDTVRTAVLMARFLCGDGEFFHEFADTIRSELLPDTQQFIRARIENMRERHAQYGESLFLLQPNIKEGAGGLRDYHAAYWALQATQPGGGRIVQITRHHLVPFDGDFSDFSEDAFFAVVIHSRFGVICAVGPFGNLCPHCLLGTSYHLL